MRLGAMLKGFIYALSVGMLAGQAYGQPNGIFVAVAIVFVANIPVMLLREPTP